MNIRGTTIICVTIIICVILFTNCEMKVVKMTGQRSTYNGGR